MRRPDAAVALSEPPHGRCTTSRGYLELIDRNNVGLKLSYSGMDVPLVTRDLITVIK